MACNSQYLLHKKCKQFSLRTVNSCHITIRTAAMISSLTVKIKHLRIYPAELNTKQ